MKRWSFGAVSTEPAGRIKEGRKPLLCPTRAHILIVAPIGRQSIRDRQIRHLYPPLPGREMRPIPLLPIMLVGPQP
jgi:hypothetical protein